MKTYSCTFSPHPNFGVLVFVVLLQKLAWDQNDKTQQILVMFFQFLYNGEVIAVTPMYSIGAVADAFRFLRTLVTIVSA